MSIPTPTAGESKETFMGRCMQIMMQEGKQRTQAAAMCSLQYGVERKKTLIWKRIDRKKAIYERKFYPGLKRAFNQQIEHIIRQFEKYGKADIIIDPDPIKKAYIELYKDVFSAFGIQAHNQTKHKKINFQIKSGEEAIKNRLTDQAENYINTEGAKLVTQVNNFTEAKVKEIVNKYSNKIINEGISLEKGAEMLKEELNTLTVGRAQRIVRTEVNRASNLGGLEGADMSNVPYLKSWLATRDARVRRTHIDAEDSNPPIQRNDQFQVGMDMLSYPGDPYGSAEETINCRCALQYIPIE